MTRIVRPLVVAALLVTACSSGDGGGGGDPTTTTTAPSTTAAPSGSTAPPDPSADDDPASVDCDAAERFAESTAGRSIETAAGVRDLIDALSELAEVATGSLRADLLAVADGLEPVRAEFERAEAEPGYVPDLTALDAPELVEPGDRVASEIDRACGIVLS